jgi:hypothetical protein
LYVQNKYNLNQDVLYRIDTNKVIVGSIIFLDFIVINGYT